MMNLRRKVDEMMIKKKFLIWDFNNVIGFDYFVVRDCAFHKVENGFSVVHELPRVLFNRTSPKLSYTNPSPKFS